MKSKFRLLLLTVIFSIAGSYAYGQVKLDKTFIGYWTQEGTSGSLVRCVIFNDKDGVLQMVLWDSSDGAEMQVIKIQVVNNTIETTEKMVSTNWVTYNSYSIENKNTLKCRVGGDGDGAVVYFKRLK